MLPEDAPPHDIWLNDDELNAHFERLKDKRRREARDRDDDNDEWEENAAAIAVLKSIGAA